MEAYKFDYSELEKKYIKQHVTENDIKDYLEFLYNIGEINKWTMKRGIKRIKVCEAWDCQDNFIPKDMRQKYCSERCRKEQDAARKRYKKHGTYLPPEAFEDKTEYVEGEYPMQRFGQDYTISLDVPVTEDGDYLEEVIDLDGVIHAKLKRNRRAEIDKEAEYYHEKNQNQPVKIYYIDV